MKLTQILLLILIIIGFVLIGTRKYWVDSVVNYILDRESQVIIDHNSGFKWRGKITAVNDACTYDGVCTITVNNNLIIINLGDTDTRGELGKLIGFKGSLQEQLNKTAEVYVGKLNNNEYTLYGSSDYYIRVVK